MTPYQLKHEISKDTTLLWIIILICLVTTWALFFHLIEWHTRFDSVYFVIMTMTTVWYGDIVPTSLVGKILTMVYALTGAPLFIFLAWFMVEHRITGLVKTYVKHHTHEIMKLETELDIINENVEQINENMDEITNNVDEITENVDEMTENMDEITENAENRR